MRTGFPRLGAQVRQARYERAQIEIDRVLDGVVEGETHLGARLVAVCDPSPHALHDE